MSQKPVIYWAVVRSWYTSLYGFDIMRVTSEKFQCAYGTYKNGVTRVRLQDIKARLMSEEAAKLALVAIKKEYEDYASKLKDVEKQVKLLQQERDNNIDKYLKGLQYDQQTPNPVSCH